MNKIISRRVKRAKRRSKHTTRKGYRKYRKHYTRKHVKRTQCQGKGRMRRQTRTRRKDGGTTMGDFNFTLPTYSNFNEPSFTIVGQGWALVTKVVTTTERWFIKKDRPEQIIILQNKQNGILHGHYFIARCASDKCIDGKKMESEVLKVEDSGFKKIDGNNGIYSFKTISNDEYRIQIQIPFGQSNQTLSNFFNSYQFSTKKNPIVEVDQEALAAARAAANASATRQKHAALEAQAAKKARAEAEAQAAADAQAAMDNMKTWRAADATAAEATAADVKMNAMVQAEADATAYVPPTSEKDRKFQELIDSINFSTPENMQKLLDLLNSMTPKTMSDLLFYLIHDIKENNITTILDDYIKLDAESMAQLLELYSFIEKREYNDNKSLFWIHRYENGKTPFSQKLIRNIKHKPETCKSVTALHEQSNQINSNGKSMFNFEEDEEFKKVLKECELYPPQIVTGGGRKRRTLKKKRGGNSKR